MISSASDPKQRAILEAAWGGFATYGYRKTSMDDIAKRAGMSRPALYLHFRNKDAILKALIDVHYAEVTRQVQEALSADGELRARLLAAFEAQGGAAIEAMLNTPHGMEVLEASMSSAGDHIEAGEAALRDIYAAWLDEMARDGAIRLSGPAQEVARVFGSAMKGVKHTSTDYDAYRAGVGQLAQLFAAGLSPR
ncbi:TetR/AcrR family transcriptional regulator [Phaeobacter gallaeciensis]|uniref:Transcriptional regulator, TetR family n=1 Tax=Phaeobacter gallaeciensis TaxID=60890 RepID=A0AAC9ZAB5_9RHOB|nr:TetR/AcrR family transcriptional regulator [Phaeobacter gallaeciensis]AHD10241.1 transcriptional regulator, TetR family [Phaeobacter gallaeciensis DSM 26640]ATE93505.1 transcriptional regulator, TetR family [Phaeobacter gallaeciensis]ATE96674.1 transcriptional regulator, TetR family [Phaeobacter gallaeciensis]ATF02169.1 transcriptional regulator, TetR family [Phaeobacter gallaeciensis]ATF06549.1 transcriptional regulator, TetR family [Phaeobacter gallaeciensis]